MVNGPIRLNPFLFEARTGVQEITEATILKNDTLYL